MDTIAFSIKKNMNLQTDLTLYNTLYDALKKAILSGEIGAGTRINESLISQELHISRTPIRNALDLLHREHLVERAPGYGVLAKGISVEDAEEIFAIRKELDTLAFAAAMRRMNQDDYKIANDILSKTSQIDTDYMNPSNYTSAFNLFIYQLSGLKRLPILIEDLQVYLSYFRQLTMLTPDRFELSRQEHRQMLIYMEQGQEKHLKDLIHHHLDGVKEDIIIQIDDQKQRIVI